MCTRNIVFFVLLFFLGFIFGYDTGKNHKEELVAKRNREKIDSLDREIVSRMQEIDYLQTELEIMESQVNFMERNNINK